MAGWLSLTVVGRSLIDALVPDLRHDEAELALEAALVEIGSRPDLAEIIEALPELDTFGKDGAAVQLFAVQPWQHVVGRLIARDRPQVTVNYVSAGGLAEYWGDHLPDLLKSSGDVRRLFNAATCPVGDLETLAPLLQAFQIPTYHRRPDGNWFTRESAGFPRSRLFDALHFCQVAADDEAAATRVEAAGFQGLVARVPQRGYRHTAALVTLFNDDRLLAPADYHSATADLLERKGDLDRAERLRDLIRRWLRNRLWAVNFVPEMVQHDQDHGVAVDRNVAYLCEDLVRPFGEAHDDTHLDTRELFQLGVSAWLHDWGHASAVMNNLIETDPVIVRELHGYLTALKLEGEASAHGLVRDGGPFRAKDEDDLAVVTLLCSHHQGKSSCDDSESTSLVTLAATLQWSAGYRPGQSFAAHCQDLLDPEKLNQGAFLRRYGRLQLQLSLLRVADAADIGAHRVSDFANQSGNKVPLVQGYLSESLARLFWIGQAADAPAYRLGHAPTDKLHTNTSYFRELMAQIENDVIWSEDQVRTIIDKFETSKHKLKESYDLVDLTQSDRWSANNVDRAWAYARHVALQVGFYSSHRQFRGVVPYLERHGEHWRLALSAVLDEHQRERGAAQKYLEDIVLREFGRRAGSAWLYEHSKQQVSVTLESAGIATGDLTFRWIESEALPWTPDPDHAYRAAQVNTDAAVDSPDGSIRATLDQDGLTFHFLNPRKTVQIPYSTAGACLLAVGGAVGNEPPRALVARQNATLAVQAVPPGSGGTQFQFIDSEATAGLILNNSAIVMLEDSIQEFDLGSRHGPRSTPAHWLAGVRAKGLDAYRHQDSYFVAVIDDDRHSVHVGMWIGFGRWRPLRRLVLPSPVTKARWWSPQTEPGLLVTHDDDTGRWYPLSKLELAGS